MEIMLGEMTAILDHHQHHLMMKPEGPSRPAKAPAWTTLSPTGSSGSSDDAAELFPWSSELRQTLRMRLQGHHTLSEENIAARVAEPATPASRKRKIWDELESLEVKSLPGELAASTDLHDEPPRVFSSSHGGTLHHLGDLRPPASPIRRYTKPKTPEGVAPGRMTSWDIDDNLAADLDGSLSGLGEDLSTASYNMSEALLALPSLTVFKQEANSPPTQGSSNRQQQHRSPPADMDRDSPTSLHHLLHTQTLTNGADGGYHSPPNERHSMVRGEVPGQHGHAGANLNNQSQQIGVGSEQGLERFQRLDKLNTTVAGEDYRFQYVLAAATSIATKINEESLTYLNQCQSYEIKLKKLGDLSSYRGTILKSVIRICFHERRLQYMEREKLAAWRQSRPGDRILELDIPLSYGLWDVVQDLEQLNTVEFSWDPTKEVGAYIKVNCISTEFTPKKHGGEKGVPFRIQVETYSQSDTNSVRRLHSAACQIKVFKLKGADRKHKQDREKIQKRPVSEQEKYQPSYECTVLTDIAPETTILFPSSSSCATGGLVGGFNGPENVQGGGSPTSMVKEEGAACNNGSGALPSQGAQQPTPTDFIEEVPVYMEPLPAEATAPQTAQWLQTQRFGQYLRTFSSFCGSDILRLTRDDMIQICGLADGIRLYNALHSKSIIPRLTLYLCQEGAQVYHALYLNSLQRSEMTSRLAELVGIPSHSVIDVYLQGPNGIHVFLTDQVVANLKDDSMFFVEIINDTSSESFRLLLKQTAPQ
ncbi:transcription factor CP2-like protein 1 [Neocloeon triangulifer]|uniref:transcription factor CP2-like protein 1 n=1 Tax=Neocloeon triangulifer TaxID=2078957 RepID=UPI00286F0D48|nr:transcription factor CP2-like protein 1 [Neocloeon triangulifer]XP_059472927.1 transcription factor CP2-like protein 1 [Neocloeon triangulifer]XP_059472928.1 transcription factor CP2-like protein 1 [Neocloeon triangulifer]XP_059472929.1 transcription factor CP2-like protein 1 [Neocloeon triangulifer]XP_059472930.1 transcription factor CP2-like protein 1 [Neocloeon triangulifer]